MAEQYMSAVRRPYRWQQYRLSKPEAIKIIEAPFHVADASDKDVEIYHHGNEYHAEEG